MIEQQYMDLIHREMDGLNSPEEQARLNQYFETNPEARKLMENMITLTRTLDNATMVEPPVGMKARIMESIGEADNASARITPIWNNIRAAFTQKLEFRYAFTFATGLAAGLLLFAFGTSYNSDSPIGSDGLSATITMNSLADKMESFSIQPIEMTGLTGSIEIRQSDDFAVAQISLNSEQTVLMHVEYDGDLLTFDSFSQENNRLSTATIEKNSIRLTHQGENRYTLLFRMPPNSNSKLHYRILNGKEDFSGEVTIGSSLR